MKHSIKHQILEFLVNKDWTYAGKIEDYIRETDGHKASNASRRCRELVEEGKLERRLVRLDSVRVVQYRVKLEDETNSSAERKQTTNLPTSEETMGGVQAGNSGEIRQQMLHLSGGRASW